MRRKLDFAERQHLEGAARFLLSDGRVVTEVNLCIEPARQHPLMVFDEAVADAHVVQPKARQCGKITVGPGVEPRRDDVDHSHRAALARPRFEQFLFAGTNGARGQLLAHHLDPFLDLCRVGAGAIPAQHELDDIGRHRELAPKPADQVLAHHMAGECLRRLAVEIVQLDQFRFSLRRLRSAWRAHPAAHSADAPRGRLASLILVGDQHADLAEFVQRACALRQDAFARDVTAQAHIEHQSCTALHLDLEPKPLQGGFDDDGRSGRLRHDVEDRQDAFLRADPAMGVFHTGVEGARPRRGRQQHAFVPALLQTRVGGRCALLEGCDPVALAARDRKSGDQLSLRQTARHQQPAMVGYDPHLASLARQAQCDIGHLEEQILCLRRQIGAEHVTPLVKTPYLVPQRLITQQTLRYRPSGRLDGFQEQRLLRRLSLIERDQIGGRGCGENARRRARQPLASGSHCRKARPRATHLDRCAPSPEEGPELLRQIHAQAVHEQQCRPGRRRWRLAR